MFSRYTQLKHDAITFLTYNGYINVALLFLSIIDVDTDTKNCVFYIGSCYGHLRLVQYLTPYVYMHDKEVAVYNASFYGHIEVVKYLVPKINEYWDSIVPALVINKTAYLYYALLDASVCGHLEVIKYMVSQGVDVNIDDRFIRSACENNQFEVVRYLIDKGVDSSVIFGEAKKYIEIYNNSQKKRRIWAQKKIYNWWIPICYRLKNEKGEYRMAVHGWNKLEK